MIQWLHRRKWLLHPVCDGVIFFDPLGSIAFSGNCWVKSEGFHLPKICSGDQNTAMSAGVRV